MGTKRLSTGREAGAPANANDRFGSRAIALTLDPSEAGRRDAKLAFEKHAEKFGHSRQRKRR